jgi:hypothetical protein
MYHSHACRLFAFCLVAGVALVCFFTSLGPADTLAKTAPERSKIYDADPDHLWNRLHEAMFVRVGPDGRAYGRDRLEPLLWYGSKHLLEEKSNKRAVALLEEFLKNNGEKLVDDPLKRAILQRDLWLVFDWLEGDHGHFYDPELKPDEVRAARDRFRHLLAAVIGRLALTKNEIEKLPDNYAAAVASGEFPKKFDPQMPDRPYLPTDLFAADGLWVCVGRKGGPVAPEHLGGINLFTNSAFLVFLKLPAGRAATVDYLKKLRDFDQPLRVGAKIVGNRTEKYLPNPKLPQFPAGTEVALVRRAILIDSSHAPVAGPITESVQLRVYREVPEMTARNVGDAVDASNSTAVNERVRAWQSFQEFQLSRARLFAGRAGGLRAVDPDERDFRTPFFQWYLDEFENPDYRSPRPNDRPFAEGSQNLVKQDCFQCHSLPGVASFNSYYNYRGNLGNSPVAAAFSLSETPASEVAAAAVKWKASRRNWAALRKLLAE